MRGRNDQNGNEPLTNPVDLIGQRSKMELMP